MLKKKDTVALVCCSNGQEQECKNSINQLVACLEELGLQVVLSPFLYQKDSVFSGSAKERGEIVNAYYRDNRIKAIMDISGGDAANMILPYLDYELIVRNPKPFWGYSDLTTILNAIYTKTGNTGMLYQVKNVVWDETGMQKHRMKEMLCKPKDSFLIEMELCKPNYRFLQGTSAEGILVGGNIRCFLKLAGTEYFPDLKAKLLLLEGLGGGVAQYATYLAHLEQLGAFEKINGILLGTFTQMEREAQKPTVEDMLLELLHQSVHERVRNLPVLKTCEIGHGTDSKLMEVGACYRF